MLLLPSERVAPLWLNSTDKSLLRIAKLGVSILNAARAMRHLLGYFTGHTADVSVDTPCLIAYRDNPYTRPSSTRAPSSSIPTD
nr:MAG TPA: hypothetical protein [Caudovirales sp. ct8Ze27]